MISIPFQLLKRHYTSLTATTTTTVRSKEPSWQQIITACYDNIAFSDPRKSRVQLKHNNYNRSKGIKVRPARDHARSSRGAREWRRRRPNSQQLVLPQPRLKRMGIWSRRWSTGWAKEWIFWTVVSRVKALMGPSQIPVCQLTKLLTTEC